MHADRVQRCGHGRTMAMAHGQSQPVNSCQLRTEADEGRCGEQARLCLPAQERHSFWRRSCFGTSAALPVQIWPICVYPQAGRCAGGKRPESHPENLRVCLLAGRAESAGVARAVLPGAGGEVGDELGGPGRLVERDEGVAVVSRAAGRRSRPSASWCPACARYWACVGRASSRAARHRWPDGYAGYCTTFPPRGPWTEVSGARR
jgi:hypothetical protein